MVFPFSRTFNSQIIIELSFQVPYYLLNPDAVFPEALRYVQLPAFKYIIGVGAVAGLFYTIVFSSLLHSIF